MIIDSIHKTFERSKWRLILNGAAPGSWNMSVDEALLYSVGMGNSPPILRLYAWQPACLSLGMAQSARDIDQARLIAAGWDWVRRPTGGRAILHTDELTYAVIVPHREPRMAGTVLESYLQISRALLHALTLIGIPVSARSEPLTDLEKVQSTGPVCFEVPSIFEITTAGKKIIGSAQSRRREGILQHGSLPLYGDLRRVTSVLAFPDETNRALAAERLFAHASTVETSLGRRVNWETAAAAFSAAFTEVLSIDWIPSEVTPDEQRLAEKICRDKYANPAWNARI